MPYEMGNTLTEPNILHVEQVFVDHNLSQNTTSGILGIALPGAMNWAFDMISIPGALPLLFVASVGAYFAYDFLSAPRVAGPIKPQVEKRTLTISTEKIAKDTKKQEQTSFFTRKWKQAKIAVVNYAATIDPNWYSKPFLIKAGSGMLAASVIAGGLYSGVVSPGQIITPLLPLSTIGVAIISAKMMKRGVAFYRVWQVQKEKERIVQKANNELDPKIEQLEKKIDENVKRITLLEIEKIKCEKSLAALQASYQEYKLDSSLVALKDSHTRYIETETKKSTIVKEIKQLEEENKKLNDGLQTLYREEEEKAEARMQLVAQRKKQRINELSPPNTPSGSPSVVRKREPNENGDTSSAEKMPGIVGQDGKGVSRILDFSEKLKSTDSIRLFSHRSPQAESPSSKEEGSDGLMRSNSMNIRGNHSRDLLDDTASDGSDNTRSTHSDSSGSRSDPGTPRNEARDSKEFISSPESTGSERDGMNN